MCCIFSFSVFFFWVFFVGWFTGVVTTAKTQWDAFWGLKGSNRVNQLVEIIFCYYLKDTVTGSSVFRLVTIWQIFSVNV